MEPASLNNWYNNYVQFLQFKGLNISQFYGNITGQGQRAIDVWLTSNAGAYYTRVSNLFRLELLHFLS